MGGGANKEGHAAGAVEEPQPPTGLWVTTGSPKEDMDKLQGADLNVEPTGISCAMGGGANQDDQIGLVKKN